MPLATRLFLSFDQSKLFKYYAKAAHRVSVCASLQLDKRTELICDNTHFTTSARTQRRFCFWRYFGRGRKLSTGRVRLGNAAERQTRPT